MEFNDFFVLSSSLTFVISGYYINFKRSVLKSEVVKTAKDRSLLIFRLLIPFSLLMSLLLYFLQIGDFVLATMFLYFGYFLIVFGLFFRWYAVKSLGKYFRVKVSLVKGQKLITDGIYKKIRHPSYTGLLLYYFGLGLIMHNYYSLLLLVCIPFFVVLHRINLEEKFLIESFGEVYKSYQKNSYGLCPFLY